MKLSQIKDRLRELKEKLEKMFEHGEHGVSTKVGELLGEHHVTMNEMHDYLEKFEAKVEGEIKDLGLRLSALEEVKKPAE